MPHIQCLPPHVADLIAAGEVVERPASVVKELVENAVDAGAKHITVEIKNGGVTYLRVTDDGKGILPEDVRTAFLRHATSKVRTERDLEAIGTLGFRGDGITTFYQRYYHMPAGLFITEIDEDSRAYQSGVRPGDILISLNGEHIMNMDDLNRAIYSHQVGDSLSLILFREDELYSLELTLEEAR